MVLPGIFILRKKTYFFPQIEIILLWKNFIVQILLLPRQKLYFFLKQGSFNSLKIKFLCVTTDKQLHLTRSKMGFKKSSFQLWLGVNSAPWSCDFQVRWEKSDSLLTVFASMPLPHASAVSGGLVSKKSRKQQLSSAHSHLPLILQMVTCCFHTSPHSLLFQPSYHEATR